jgi:dTDP-4-dehydrorhamnose 3,5-epimerase
MKDESIVAYLVTTPYSPKNEYEINPLDDELGINWGLNTKDYILSKKDLTAMSLNHAESLGQLPK